MAQVGQFSWVALPSQNSIYDGQPSQPGYIADDVVDLKVHLRKCFLHVLDMLCRNFYQVIAVAQQRSHCANILLGPLKLMAGPLARLAAPGSRLILSGLLPGQANAALTAYRAHGLVLERRILIDGWATLVLARPLRRARRARRRSQNNCIRPPMFLS